MTTESVAIPPLTLVADVRVHFALRAPKVPAWFEPKIPQRPTAPARPDGRTVNQLIDKLLAPGDDSQALRDAGPDDRQRAQAFVRQQREFEQQSATWLQLRDQERLAQWPWFYAAIVMHRADLRITEVPALRDPRPMNDALRAAMAAPGLTPQVVPPKVTGPNGESLEADVECQNCPWEGPSWSIEKDGVLGPCPKCASNQLRRKGA